MNNIKNSSLQSQAITEGRLNAWVSYDSEDPEELIPDTVEVRNGSWQGL